MCVLVYPGRNAQVAVSSIFHSRLVILDPNTKGSPMSAVECFGSCLLLSKSNRIPSLRETPTSSSPLPLHSGFPYFPSNIDYLIAMGNDAHLRVCWIDSRYTCEYCFVLLRSSSTFMMINY